MEFVKEKLLYVNGLSLSNTLAEMNDLEYEELCSAFNSFIDIYPSMETLLKVYFNSKDYSAFTDTLSKIRELLARIGALGLDLSCKRLIDELNAHKFNIVEAHLTYLLAEISALSIDIQLTSAEETEQENIEASSPYSYNAIEQNRTKHKEILAVDDISVMLLNLKAVFQNTKYRFTGVTSAKAAFMYLQKFTPDLFILDIAMPDISGYELTKELRKRGQTAPVIFLTGNATAEYVRKALAVGAVDFIVKPVNADSVIQKVRKHIG